ncbi:MAG: ABC-type uncharacterized transport system substrate-binding protein [bacterium]|jgi:ABC-type uncharacterized transport system substrate-binding protein
MHNSYLRYKIVQFFFVCLLTFGIVSCDDNSKKAKQTQQKTVTQKKAVVVAKKAVVVAKKAVVVAKKASMISPVLNNGKKWRIGYIQGGPYRDYHDIFTATIRSLMDLGWIEKGTIPKATEKEGNKVIWQWLAKQKSNYLEFVQNGYYSSNWDKKIRPNTKTQLINRLNTKKGLDLVIAMGTWAGQDLANNKHSTSTIVLSTSDPLQSKIITSITDSGFDHLHATIDPTRYERQVQLFHDIIKFKKLGVIYEDSLEGRSYAALSDIQKVSKAKGFSIVSCIAKFSTPKPADAERNVVKCTNELAKKVDALYIPVHSGVNTKNMPALLKPLYENKIPTFSQSGSIDVQYGVLLSIAQAQQKYVGQFHADTIAKVLHGVKPRSLKMIFEEPPKIAINLKAAKLISYDPPVDILGVADEIYQEIKKAEKEK